MGVRWVWDFIVYGRGRSVGSVLRVAVAGERDLSLSRVRSTHMPMPQLNEGVVNGYLESTRSLFFQSM